MDPRERIRLVDIREQCAAPGCGQARPKWAKFDVYDAAGVLVGRYCKACAERERIRQLRREGVKPFNGEGDQR